MSVAETKLLTIEQLAKLPDTGRPTELVRGRIVQMNPPKPVRGYVCANVQAILRDFVKPRELGRVLGNDSGIVTERDPDTVRGADVAFYSFERLPRGPLPDTYPSAAPELVFEVRSEDDRWPKVLAKVAEYLNAGVDVVCVLDPKAQTVRVFGADGSDQLFSVEHELVLPAVLPDFCVPIKEFFE